MLYSNANRDVIQLINNKNTVGLWWTVLSIVYHLHVGKNEIEKGKQWMRMCLTLTSSIKIILICIEFRGSQEYKTVWVLFFGDHRRSNEKKS